MIVKLEFDLEDDAQFDAFSQMLALIKKLGFHAGNDDVLRKVQEPVQEVRDDEGSGRADGSGI